MKPKNKGYKMAIKKKSFVLREVKKGRETDKQILDVLNKHKEDIINAYNDGASLTNIANSLQDMYGDDFEEREVETINKKGNKEITKTAPVVRMNHIKAFLKKNRIID